MDVKVLYLEESFSIINFFFSINTLSAYGSDWIINKYVIMSTLREYDVELLSKLIRTTFSKIFINLLRFKI